MDALAHAVDGGRRPPSYPHQSKRFGRINRRLFKRGAGIYRSVDGPIGPFAHGTELIIEGLLGQFGHKPFSVLGGGDTVGYIEARGLLDYFDHVSTGGGASMELMSGKKLPGVEALNNKD